MNQEQKGAQVCVRLGIKENRMLNEILGIMQERMDEYKTLDTIINKSDAIRYCIRQCHKAEAGR